jgi:hypothetical protein
VFETLEVSHSMANLIPLYVNQNAVYDIPRILRDLELRIYGLLAFAMA